MTSPASGSMPAGRRCNRERVAVLAGQFGDLPRGKAFGMPTEPLCADFRRQHALGGFEKIAPRMIEIVRMLVVAEQHGIDLADIIGAERRADQLF